MELVSNFIGDSNLHCTYEVVKQTPRTITLQSEGKQFKRKIYNCMDGRRLVCIAGGEFVRIDQQVGKETL